MIYYISSKQNQKIKDAQLLFKESERSAKQLFLIEGFHLLEMALKDNLVVSIFSLKEIKDIDENIPQYIVNEDILAKISSQKNPQGVVAIVKMKKEKEITSKKVLYLDDVSDPGNMGTILRTALAFGYLDVIVSKNSVSIYNSKVIQASQGAIFKLNIVKKDSSILKDLRSNDYQIVSTEIKGSISLKEVKHIDKFVLVLGNEAHGVSEEVLNLSDLRVRIDINDIESLNVAIAGAIAMYVL